MVQFALIARLMSNETTLAPTFNNTFVKRPAPEPTSSTYLPTISSGFHLVLFQK